MKILFAGTPEFAVPTLNTLISASRNPDLGIELVGILTNPDAPGKRGKNPVPPPVKLQATEHFSQSFPRVPLFQPQRLDGQVRQEIGALGADLLVCVAYGKIFGPKFLGLFPSGGINLHPSLLPKYRGPAPVQAAILNGETTSGITVQQLAQKMDGGDILIQETRDIGPDQTAAELLDRWSREGAEMVLRAILAIQNGTSTPRAQDDNQATYCTMLTKDMGYIDWNQPAETIGNLIRALVPWPLAWTTWQGQRLFIHKASPVDGNGVEIPGGNPGEVVAVDKDKGILVQTGAGLLAIHSLQLQTKKQLPWKDFLHGARDLPGSRLGGNQ